MVSRGSVNYTVAPNSYEDLFRIYYDYVVRMVGKAGIEPQYREDIASEILLRFYERNFLYEFDSSRLAEYKGQVRRVRFKTFLTTFVFVYVRNHRDRQSRLRRSEWLICDAPVGESGQSWISVFGEAADVDFLAGLAEQELVARLRRHLSSVPPRNERDRCNLVELFDAMVSRIRDGAHRVTIDELRHEFGTSSTEMGYRLKWLRTNLREALTG